MDNNSLIAAKLNEAGLTFFGETAIEDLSNLYQGVLYWQTLLEDQLKFETAPAAVFNAAQRP